MKNVEDVSNQMINDDRIDLVFQCLLGRSPSEDDSRTISQALQSGSKTIQDVIESIRDLPDAKALALDVVRPDLANLGFFSRQEHFLLVLDVIYRTALGRVLSEDDKAALGGVEKVQERPVDVVIWETINSPEARRRFLNHIRADLAGSGYKDRQAQLSEIVDVIFKTALGRPILDQDRAAYIQLAAEKSIDAVIQDLNSTTEAKQRWLSLAYSEVGSGEYIHKRLHFSAVTDVLFRSILGRKAEAAERDLFSGWLEEGTITIDDAISELLNGDEVRTRILRIGLPDVLEGIYRALNRTPEANDEVRDLVRGAASVKTFEMIRTMVQSIETQHYLLKPILALQAEELSPH